MSNNWLITTKCSWHGLEKDIALQNKLQNNPQYWCIDWPIIDQLMLCCHLYSAERACERGTREGSRNSSSDPKHRVDRTDAIFQTSNRLVFVVTVRKWKEIPVIYLLRWSSKLNMVILLRWTLLMALNIMVLNKIIDHRISVLNEMVNYPFYGPATTGESFVVSCLRTYVESTWVVPNDACYQGHPCCGQTIIH